MILSWHFRSLQLQQWICLYSQLDKHHPAGLRGSRQVLAGRRTLPGMDRTAIEHRLIEGSQQLRRAHEELGDVDDRLSGSLERAEDLRLRAALAETPLASDMVIDAQRRVDALVEARKSLSFSISELRQAQDKLLEQL